MHITQVPIPLRSKPDLAKKPGKKSIIIVAVIAALFSAYLVYRFRPHERLLFSIKEWRHAHEWKQRSVWLPDYRATVEALPVQGVKKNLSGLTWNGETGTLFAVINSPAQIVELSTSGVLLRTITLIGFDDPEAVEYIGDNNFIVADERTQKIVQVFIDAGTREINTLGLQRLTLGMGPAGNRGLEGLAWDFSNKKLYAAKESNPVHIYEVTGFPQAPDTTLDIEVASNRKRDGRLFVSDVSSLDFNRRHQHLLVLSDESKLILEIDKEGRPVSSLSLALGAGLTKPVPQAEGIAMDDDDILYLVSEPNLFYVFEKKSGD